MMGQTLMMGKEVSWGTFSVLLWSPSGAVPRISNSLSIELNTHSKSSWKVLSMLRKYYKSSSFPIHLGICVPATQRVILVQSYHLWLELFIKTEWKTVCTGLWLRDFLLQVNEIPTQQGGLQDPGGSAYCLPLQLHLLLSPFTNHTAASLDLCSDPQKPFPATSSPGTFSPQFFTRLLGSLCSSSLKVNFPDSTMWPNTFTPSLSLAIARHLWLLELVISATKTICSHLLPFGFPSLPSLGCKPHEGRNISLSYSTLYHQYLKSLPAQNRIFIEWKKKK